MTSVKYGMFSRWISNAITTSGHDDVQIKIWSYETSIVLHMRFADSDHTDF